MEIDFFDEEGVGSELIGTVDVGNPVGGGQDDNGKGAEAILLTNPRKECEAVHARKFEVQEDDGRERMLGAVVIFAFARKVRYRLFARADNLHGIVNSGLLKAPVHEENVIL
jgi:hypothetical protein